MKNAVICDNCHNNATKAKWIDLFKTGDKIIYVEGVTPYDEDGTYHLDILSEVLKSKGLTKDEIDEGAYLSMNEAIFTTEDIKNASIGIEHTGAHCLVCNSIL